jgi:hypothetical protein
VNAAPALFILAYVHKNVKLRWTVLAFKRGKRRNEREKENEREREKERKREGGKANACDLSLSDVPFEHKSCQSTDHLGMLGKVLRGF